MKESSLKLNRNTNYSDAVKSPMSKSPLRKKEEVKSS